jgi:hypothetical protein
MDGEAVTNLNMMPAAAATVMVTAQWMGFCCCYMIQTSLWLLALVFICTANFDVSKRVLRVTSPLPPLVAALYIVRTVP